MKGSDVLQLKGATWSPFPVQGEEGAGIYPNPEWIQVDNGSEFISKDFDRWAYENGVKLDYSWPGGRRTIRILNLLTEVYGMGV